MADYEEQVLITGIKKNQQCPICKVPPKERENLMETWEPRTHQDTQAQIQKQAQNRQFQKGHKDWVHPIRNFAWQHYMVNIHACMMSDVLHQLLKGIVMMLIYWIQALVNVSVTKTTKRNKHKGNRTIKESDAIFQLDERFRQVPVYRGLKQFTHFSEVRQWTGNEQKQMLRQLISVVALLLVDYAPAALHCARAVLDFVMMAQYNYHNEDTLSYMSHALYRIDKLKRVFKESRPQAKDTEERHFNIPKLHAMTHYIDFIKKYGSATGFDTCYGEAAHKYLMKEFFPRTNKGETFQQQILLHNTRRHNMVAMADMILYRKTIVQSQAEADMEPELSKPSRDRLDLLQLGMECSPVDVCHLAGLAVSPATHRQWRRAGQVASCLTLDGLIEALAVFVRENRKKWDGVFSSSDELDQREADAGWACNLLIGLHSSMVCWRLDGKDGANPEKRTEEYVRCSPNWRGKANNWRRDYVWVQEHTVADAQGLGHPNGQEGRLLGQLQLILTVLDNERHDWNGRARRYTGAFVETFRWCNGGECNDIHGMFEVERHPINNARNPRKLGPRRIYEMPTIIRSAHVVPSNEQGTRMFVNNWLDLESYNTLFDKDWKAKGIREADRLARKL